MKGQLLVLNIARIGMKPASISANSTHFLKTKDKDPNHFLPWEWPIIEKVLPPKHRSSTGPAW